MGLKQRVPFLLSVFAGAFSLGASASAPLTPSALWVVVVNPTTNKIEAEWSTLPATGPHGLAIDSKAARVFIAGHNGKLVGLDLKSGKKFAEVEISPGTDQISFDTASKTIYCASKGYISVVKETDVGLEALGNIPAPTGAHTLAVDSQRHNLWISYADRLHSYLQRISP